MTQIASHLVTLRLPADMIHLIERTARAQAKSPADLIRGALLASLSQGGSTVAERLRKHVALAECFELADGWLDLQAQLRGLGFVLRHNGEEQVCLHDFPSQDFLCSLHDIGQNLGALTRRYHSPFPGLRPEAAVEAAPEPVPAPMLQTAPQAATETAEIEPLVQPQPVFHSLRRKPRPEPDRPKLVAVSTAPTEDELDAAFSNAMFRSRRAAQAVRFSAEPDLRATPIAS
ncbi:hypothetical protein [Thioclava sp. GXIMD4215]|uniref:hypothetical protein n=1 Tax=Thioclava sp. GXIMD4215 TaxID=3131928 RepID=UPI003250950F